MLGQTNKAGPRPRHRNAGSLSNANSASTLAAFSDASTTFADLADPAVNIGI